jgi:hypothetical protein
MTWFLYGAAALHGAFAIAEIFPWPFPLLLGKLSRKLPGGHQWTPPQQALVATIVHNAGIYNAVIAAGLVWAAMSGDSARDVAQVLFAGAAVAGVFGTATLKSPVTALQALVGMVGVALV